VEAGTGVGRFRKGENAAMTWAIWFAFGGAVGLAIGSVAGVWIESHLRDKDAEMDKRVECLREQMRAESERR